MTGPRRLRIAVLLVVALGGVGWGVVRGVRPGPHNPILRTLGPAPKLRRPDAGVVAYRDAQEADVPAPEGPVTYSGAVASILREKCQDCHRPGQVAPFSLLTYDQAYRWRRGIKEVVLDRRMPPWHADPRHGHFANDRGLSAGDRRALVAWVDQGAPLGDPAGVPAPRVFPEGWSIGEPDVVFSMDEPFTVPAEGVLSYQKFRVKTHFPRDVWVQALEARPGDRKVVHHVCVFLEDKVVKEDGRLERPELVCYAPGDRPSVFPKGTAKKIPAGATLVFELHYTPIGTPRADRSSVGLIFARDPVSRRAISKGIAAKTLRIPPGARNHEVRSSFTFPFEARLLSLSPHMHLRGRDFVYRATFPDGHSEVLLSIPAYDFAWQSVYRLAEPRTLPAGTRIDCLAHFDNSADNPNNPDPKAEVVWGDQTWDEMMIGYIDYDVAEPTVIADRPDSRRR